MYREYLSKQEVIDVIERKAVNAKIPLMRCKWWGDGLEDELGTDLEKMAAQYPEDIFNISYEYAGLDKSPNQNPHYRWGYKDYSNQSRNGIGQNIVLLDDWDELDQLLADFPDPNEPGTFDEVNRQIAERSDRYNAGIIWTLFHERFWAIRGMENMMIDYYENMDELKRLGAHLITYYKALIDRYIAAGVDGMFFSDDLGHQTGPMMSPKIFAELYYPLYKELGDYLHKNGLHFLLHTCGDNTLFMDFLIDAGVDVIHPIQKGCMDEQAIAKKYGDKITFLYGFDVQHCLPYGTVQDIENEFEYIKRTFYKPEGGLLIAAGNGIMPGTPLENIETFLSCAARG